MSTRNQFHSSTARPSSRGRQADTASAAIEGGRGAEGHNVTVYRSRNPFLNSRNGTSLPCPMNISSAPETRSSSPMTALDTTDLDTSISVYSQESSSTPDAIPETVLGYSPSHSASRTPRLFTPFQIAAVPSSNIRPHEMHDYAAASTGFDVSPSIPPPPPPPPRSSHRHRSHHSVASSTSTILPDKSSHGDKSCENREEHLVGRRRLSRTPSVQVRSRTPTRPSSVQATDSATHSRRALVPSATVVDNRTTMNATVRPIQSLSSVPSSYSATSIALEAPAPRRDDHNLRGLSAAHPPLRMPRLSLRSDPTMFDRPHGDRSDAPSITQSRRSLSIPSSPQDAIPPIPPKDRRQSEYDRDIVAARSRINSRDARFVQPTSRGRSIPCDLASHDHISREAQDTDRISTDASSAVPSADPRLSLSWTVIDKESIPDQNSVADAQFGAGVAFAILSLYAVYRDDSQSNSARDQLLGFLESIDQNTALCKLGMATRDVVGVLWEVVGMLDVHHAKFDIAADAQSHELSRKRSTTRAIVHKASRMRSISLTRRPRSHSPVKETDAQAELVIYKIQRLLHSFAESPEETSLTNFVVLLRKSMGSHPTWLHRLIHIPTPSEYNRIPRPVLDHNRAAPETSPLCDDSVYLVDIVKYLTDPKTDWRRDSSSESRDILDTFKLFLGYAPEMDTKKVVRLIADSCSQHTKFPAGTLGLPDLSDVDQTNAISLWLEILRDWHLQISTHEHAIWKFVGLGMDISRLFGNIKKERVSAGLEVSDEMDELEQTLDAFGEYKSPYYVAHITAGSIFKARPTYNVPHKYNFLDNWDHADGIELLSQVLAYYEWDLLNNGAAAELVLDLEFPLRVESWSRLCQQWVTSELVRGDLSRAHSFFVKLMHRCFTTRNISSALILLNALSVECLELKEPETSMYNDVNTYFLTRKWNDGNDLSLWPLLDLAIEVQILHKDRPLQPLPDDMVPLGWYRKLQKYGYILRALKATYNDIIKNNYSDNLPGAVLRFNSYIQTI